MQVPFRLTPRGRSQDYKTYRFDAPVSTHYRQATCAEIDCEQYLHGWQISVLPDSPEEAAVRASGRRWDPTLSQRTEGGFMLYVFPPGQPCFRASAHRAPLDREPAFSVVAGDYRTPRPALLRRHVSAADWVDDFANHQQAIADAVRRG